ncbi:hypothetical protein C8R41DRAFT_475177 [Lentinula lateritia]|uniref:Uncharacterized protein n=1 Tax=Lentinula lateritia TaxID=40482 RepID=A0ABQ8V925_9AGAR|nr:hypothetical protein C8R41DRAFT_475177 [Lentinula lateritia]
MQLFTSIAVLGSLLVEQPFLLVRKFQQKLFSSLPSIQLSDTTITRCLASVHMHIVLLVLGLFSLVCPMPLQVRSTAEPHPNQDSVLIGHLQPRRAPIRTGPLSSAQIPTSPRIPPLHITFVEGIELGQPLQNVDISTSAKDIVENSVKEFAQYHQRTLSFLNNYRPSYIDYIRGIRFWVHDTLPNNLCHQYCAGVASLGSDNVSEFYHGLLNSNSGSFPEINWEEI